MGTPVALAESEIHKPIEFFEGVATMPTLSEQEAKYERDLRDWMARLAQKESSGSCDVSIIDKNSLTSKGIYQYQDATWLGKGKQYGLPTTLENITDCELQTELTYRILKNEPQGWRNWQCSTIGCPQWDIVGMGLPPRNPML